MIIEAHIRCSGNENTREVLAALDEAGVDLAVLLGSFLTPPYTLDDPAALRHANQHLSQLVGSHAGRLVGFAVVNPLHCLVGYIAGNLIYRPDGNRRDGNRPRPGIAPAWARTRSTACGK